MPRPGLLPLLLCGVGHRDGGDLDQALTVGRLGVLGQHHWLASDHRAVLLTVFPKTRQRESKEVARALQAQKTCEAGHPPAGEHDVYER